jgi:hypothetical protein
MCIETALPRLLIRHLRSGSCVSRARLSNDYNRGTHPCRRWGEISLSPKHGRQWRNTVLLLHRLDYGTRGLNR